MAKFNDSFKDKFTIHILFKMYCIGICYAGQYKNLCIIDLELMKNTLLIYLKVACFGPPVYSAVMRYVFLYMVKASRFVHQ